MENVIDFAGLGNFVLYFGTALVFLLAFKYLNLWLTPYDEWVLIKEQKKHSGSHRFGWFVAWLLCGYLRGCFQLNGFYGLSRVGGCRCHYPVYCYGYCTSRLYAEICRAYREK